MVLQEGVPPLVVMGLLQQECKLCVVNFGVRKAPTYTHPLPNKEELLLVTGLRSFTARPVFSTDEHGADKHKMERFLHEGRWVRSSAGGKRLLAGQARSGDGIRLLLGRLKG